MIDLGATYYITDFKHLAAGGTGGYVEADSMTGVGVAYKVSESDSAWTSRATLSTSADGAWETVSAFNRDARYIRLNVYG